MTFPCIQMVLGSIDPVDVGPGAFFFTLSALTLQSEARGDLALQTSSGNGLVALRQSRLRVSGLQTQ
jgi:hypothetical protein